jgi:hypothetical protein
MPSIISLNEECMDCLKAGIPACGDAIDESLASVDPECVNSAAVCTQLGLGNSLPQGSIVGAGAAIDKTSPSK